LRFLYQNPNRRKEGRTLVLFREGSSGSWLAQGPKLPIDFGKEISGKIRQILAIFSG